MDVTNDDTDMRFRRDDQGQGALPESPAEIRGGSNTASDRRRDIRQEHQSGNPRIISVRRKSKPGYNQHPEMPPWNAAKLREARMKRLGGYGRSPQARRFGMIWSTKVRRVSKQLRSRWTGSEKGQHRDRTPQLSSYILKVIELRLRATPAKVATYIKRLSNRILKDEGFLPFTFGPTTNLRDKTIRAEFQDVILEVLDIAVFPVDPPSTAGRLSSPDLHLGWIDLLAVGQDAKGADWCLLTFTCHEREWMRFIERWNRLVDEFRQLEVTMERPVNKREHPPAEESPSIEAKSTDTKRKPGRKPYLDDDWAFEQLYIHKRKWNKVFEEWKKKIPPQRLGSFGDPLDAFTKAMKRRHDKWEGRNMP